MSVPISATIVCAVMTLIPSIEHGLTPQIRVSSSSRFAILGWLSRTFEPFFLFLFSPPSCWFSAAREISGTFGSFFRYPSNCLSHSSIRSWMKW